MAYKKSFFTIISIIIFSNLFLFIPLFGSAVDGKTVLSEQAEITLLTSSPGEELYSIFGHSALRVVDPEKNIDLAYNYGTFDFDTPNFYLKFGRGQLMYKLSVGSYRNYEYIYRREGRAVYEQVLDLNQQEKQRVYDFLTENALPENRYYRYDFFYDNCATRIRDLIDDLLVVEWFEYPYEEKPRTFRELLAPFLEHTPWNKFGTDIALGMPSDITASAYEYMFLPDEMYIGFASARMADGSPLVSEYRTLVEESLVRQKPDLFNPLLVCWLVFIAGLLSFLKPTAEKVFDMVFFSILCVNGIIIMFLWFASEHTATNNNMNLLWSLPTHIYFFFNFHFRQINRFSRWYFKIIMLLMLFFVVFWPWMPQGLNPAFFPVILLVLIKSVPPALNIDIAGKLKRRVVSMYTKRITACKSLKVQTGNQQKEFCSLYIIQRNCVKNY